MALKAQRQCQRALELLGSGTLDTVLGRLVKQLSSVGLALAALS